MSALAFAALCGCAALLLLRQRAEEARKAKPPPPPAPHPMKQLLYGDAVRGGGEQLLLRQFETENPLLLQKQAALPPAPFAAASFQTAPIPPVASAARRVAEALWDRGGGVLPPGWTWRTSAATGEPEFMGPAGACTSFDPRRSLDVFTAEFLAAEQRGVNIAALLQGAAGSAGQQLQQAAPVAGQAEVAHSVDELAWAAAFMQQQQQHEQRQLHLQQFQRQG